MFRPSSTLPPVIENTDPNRYHEPSNSAKRGDKDYVMSRSELWRFGDCECPLEWKLTERDKASRAMRWGDLIDCLVLTPDRFEKDFVIRPEKYFTDGMLCPSCGDVSDSKSCRHCKKERIKTTIEKDWNWNSTHCIEWKEEQEAKGLKVVGPEEASNAHLAVKQFEYSDYLSKFHSVSRKQVQINVEWHDETGIVVPFKCLIDLLPDPQSDFGDTIADIKTTEFIKYRDWCRRIHIDGLNYQAAVYLDAVNAATGLNYIKFEHHIQKSSAPYLVTHRMLSDDFLIAGRVRYRRDLADYCQCLLTNKWRSYDSAISEPESWMLTA